ncbi:MAG TPA: MerR family transcriptional regulator [Chloroflexia bacterium]|nr:MerR family transcriptional regulator [Chloroflexia bacterium]
MFRIGEFSKIAQVSGRLLRYYDELGLLSPDFTDPQTGYRYYSAEQLPRLNRILVLKELGLSLDQIIRLLAQNSSVEEIRGMLALRKAQIEQSLKEEMERLRVVESRLQQLDLHGQMQEPDVVLKSLGCQEFLGIREVFKGMADVQRLVQQIHNALPAALGQNNLGQMAVLMHFAVYDPQALDLEIGFFISGKAPKSFNLTEERVLTRRTLPAVETMATLVHQGRLDEIHQSYGALGSWIEQNNWQLAGNGREILMQLPQPNSGDGVVFEIQLPVVKWLA